MPRKNVPESENLFPAMPGGPLSPDPAYGRFRGFPQQGRRRIVRSRPLACP
jgi:hypothetical protein